MDFKVIKIDQEDADTGIAKLNKFSLLALGIDSGEYIEIIGKKAIYLLAFADPKISQGCIAIDNTAINSLRTEEGGFVKIAGAPNIEKCKKVILTPRMPKNYAESDLKKVFKGYCVFRGTAISCKSAKGPHIFDVLETIPEEPCIITDSTEIIVKSRLKNNFEGVLYNDIGGLKKQLTEIRDIIELQLMHPEIYSKLGVKTTKGILIYGPPGTGKTLIAKAIATETDAFFISINAPEMMSKFVGESEENLRNVFKLAKENAPSIIFIDEIDAIAPKRDEGSEAERRIVAQLLTLMDGLEQHKGIVVIGATNRRDSIDDALRRPGRFDREIEITVPDEVSRKEILEIHTRTMPLAANVDIERLAKVTYGYTGADIEALCKEAAMHALTRAFGKERIVNKSAIENLKVNMNDFEHALKSIEPSALREVMRELPYASWNDIGGLENEINNLRSAIENKLELTEKAKELGIELPKGILIAGESGTGKTLVARAIAHNVKANFIYISCTGLLSKYVGEGEKIVRHVFGKARNAAPCILFFDSLEALAGKSRTIARQITMEMDALPENVLVIGAINSLDKIGRILIGEKKFEMVFNFPLPNYQARVEILKIYISKMKTHNIDIELLAEATDGLSGGAIRSLCTKAGFNCLKRNGNAVSMVDFEEAIGIKLLDQKEKKKLVKKLSHLKYYDFIEQE